MSLLLAFTAKQKMTTRCDIYFMVTCFEKKVIFRQPVAWETARNLFFSPFVGGLFHRHIPLPAALHHLHPWSDAPWGWGGTQVLPHP